MNMPKRYRQMIIAALICLVTVTLTMFAGVNPMMDAANNANLGTEQNDALLNLEISKVHHLQMLTRNKTVMDAQAQQLADAMPEEPHVSTLVDALNGYANSNGLVVTSLTVGDPEKYVVAGKVHAQKEFQQALLKAGSSIKDIPVNLTVDGSFNALLSFLNDVENSPRVTLVKSLDFQAAQVPGHYVLDLQAYVFMVTHRE
jgi:Tfp pilus assembly protein PilO